MTSQPAFDPARRPAEPLPELATVAKLFPGFEILEESSRSGLHASFRVRQGALDRVLLLRVYHPGAHLEPLRGLAHPGLTPLHQVGSIAGWKFVIADWEAASSLRSCLAAGGRMPVGEALRVFGSLAKPLLHARAAGLPLCGVSCADIFPLDAGDLHVDVSGAPSPGQLPRSDSAALATILYEMLTGAPASSDPTELGARVLVAPQLSQAVMDGLGRGDGKDPADFVGEIAQVAKALGSSAKRSGRSLGPWFGSFEYRSRLRVLGMPILHVALGTDPRTGIARTAGGLIAVGGGAVGVVAIGGWAVGGVAIGGLAAGGIAIGGLALGLSALGTAAFGCVGSVAAFSSGTPHPSLAWMSAWPLGFAILIGLLTAAFFWALPAWLAMAGIRRKRLPSSRFALTFGLILGVLLGVLHGILRAGGA